MRTRQQSVGARRKQARSYYPFKNGMRGRLFFGEGANYQSNLQQNDGFLKKLGGENLLTDLTDFSLIHYQVGFRKADGTVQTVVFGLDSGGDIKVRVIEPSGSVLTPAGDPTFTGTITARQYGAVLIIMSSGTTQKWDGSALASLSGSPAISCARDGSRIAYIDGSGTTKFSDNAAADGFTGGTGANAAGEYNSSIPSPTAVIEGGTGVVFFGQMGAEAHWVQPNNASDEVSSRTKIESFSYKGLGITDERKVCNAGQYIYFVNREGIFEMNPFSGQAVNLCVGGKIERYWETKIKSDFASIAYDPENDLIVCAVALDSNQNNQLVIINPRTQEREPLLSIDKFYAHLATIDNGLYGGGQRNGEISQIFQSFSDIQGQKTKARYISDWDAQGSPLEEKTFFGVSASMNFNAEAKVVIKVYFDGSTSPTFSKTYTTKDLNTLSNSAAYGNHVLALGASDLVVENSVGGQRDKLNRRYRTIAIEVSEESKEPFVLYDLIVEYKKRGRIRKTLALPNELF